jgi:integrase/recombinase XerD
LRFPAGNDTEAEWLIERNPTADINLRRDFTIKNNAEYVRALHRDDRQDIIAVSPEKIAKLADHVPGEKPETRTRNELIIRMLCEKMAEIICEVWSMENV